MKTTGDRLRQLRLGNPGLREEIHDPYRSRSKTRGPAACPNCGATYIKGHWTWQQQEHAPTSKMKCPACRRIEDRVPAGIISLEGEYLHEHADEALRIVHNTEKLENGNHPLHRIMEIIRDGARIEIHTTDVHLPRRIGHALEDAWGGTLDTHYDEEGYLARVHWRRDE